MSDSPRLSKEKKEEGKLPRGQMTLWPFLPEDIQDEQRETAKIDEPQEEPSTILFGETLLALASIKGLGFRTLIKISKTFDGRLELIWESTQEELRQKFAPFKTPLLDKLAAQLVDNRDNILQIGKENFLRLSEERISIIPRRNLPHSLCDIPDAPHWLFVKGDRQLLYQKPAVAVVGTRKPTKEGLNAAAVVARHIAAYPVVLVSGLAEGIDERAHQVSLQDELKNIAFLGHGINLSFPTSSEHIRERILETGGALVTEYLPNESYRREYFVARNRLQAAISELVIPIEANPKGGTAHTIRFARQYKRQLMGIRWEGANGVLQELEKEGYPIIDIFTPNGRRRFDLIIRELAEKYGKSTYALSAVERRLFTEIEQRALRRSDVSRLLDSLQELLQEETDV